MRRLIALVADENARLVDVAVASDWGPPRRQKKLAATAGLDNTAGCGALGELAALLAPRAARRCAHGRRRRSAGAAGRRADRGAAVRLERGGHRVALQTADGGMRRVVAGGWRGSRESGKRVGAGLGGA